MAPSMSVGEYYKDKSVFITGATGFMGKVLVEKLLRSCPEVAKLYILVRPKRGQASAERLETFLNCPVFANLRENDSKSLQKIVLLSGDILVSELGLSAKDKALLQDVVQIVFHCAACVRFNQFIRDAVNLNTGGTKKVLALCENMKKLEALIHVSTAYSRCELDVLEEKVYPTEHRPDDVLDMVAWMDDEVLRHLEPKLIAPQPNTYAYTKSLTEDLVSQYSGKLPIAIARPSIVTASWKEPIPGWVDNLNGPTGLMVGAGKGVIRTMHLEGSYLADVVPVDIVVNGCILLGRKIGLERPKEVQVYNITESGQNPLTWETAIELGRKHVQEFPFTACLWYPGGSPKSSWLLHNICVIFTHMLPAYFIDLLLYLLGKKTFMVRVQKKINAGLKVLQYYTTKAWNFRNDNYLKLKTEISEEDNNMFYTDIKEIDWSLYLRDYIKGARKYCCKEDPSTLPKARKIQRILYYTDRTIQLLFYILCMWFIYSYLHIFISALDFVGTSLVKMAPMTRAKAEEL